MNWVLGLAAGACRWMSWLVELAAFSSGVVAVGASELAIRNLRVEQVPGQLAVEILYDLEGAAGAHAWVEVAISEDGGRTFVPLREGLAGAVGRRVESGANRRVEWNRSEVWLGRARGEWVFRVTADDGPRPVEGMVWIPAGSFLMGSPASEAGRDLDEGPQTEVRLSRGYWLGKYEVTQGEWEAVMGSNPSRFKGEAKLPVDQVSWEEAMEYCRRLMARERQAGRLSERGWEYRLPTEAQWEYACRAGTTTATAYGDGLGSRQANFDGNSPYGGAAKGPYLQKTVWVGSYAPNAWGLYDMHGNVWEWCLDWYEGRLLGGSVVDPAGPKSGSLRVFRGGGWNSVGHYCRSAYRIRSHPGLRSNDLSFRLAMVPVP